MSISPKERRYLLYVIGLTLVVLSLLSIFKKSPSHHPLEEEVWRVKVKQAHLSNNTPFITLHGTTEATQFTTIKSALTADVLDTFVEEGHRVKRGDKLLSLDCRTPILELNKLASKATNLKHEITLIRDQITASEKTVEHQSALLKLIDKAIHRQQQLFKRKLGSEAALDNETQRFHQQSLDITQTKLNIQNLKTRLNQIASDIEENSHQQSLIKIDIDYCEPKAPFDGIILKRLVSKGNRVNRDDNLITLFDPTAIQIRAHLPEKYLSEVQHLSTAEKTLKVYDSDNNPYKIRSVNPDSRATQGSTELILIPEKPDPNLLLGKIKTYYLLLPQIKNSMSIPTAVIYQNKRIYRINNDKLESLNVVIKGEAWTEQPQLDGTSNTIVQANNLREGDLILLTPIPQARDNLKVSIIHAQKNH